MEKTVNFEMTESQAEKFEKLLDSTLEIFNRWENERPERDMRMDKMREETRQNISETEKNSQEVEQYLNKWRVSAEQ